MSSAVHDEKKQSFYDRLRDTVGHDIWDKAMPHQRDGLASVVQSDGRKAVFDEAGLGKTLQTILGVSYYAEDLPVLVGTIAPSCGAWRDEFIKWAGIEPERIVILGDKSSKRTKKQKSKASDKKSASTKSRKRKRSESDKDDSAKRQKASDGDKVQKSSKKKKKKKKSGESKKAPSDKKDKDSDRETMNLEDDEQKSTADRAEGAAAAASATASSSVKTNEDDKDTEMEQVRRSNPLVVIATYDRIVREYRHLLAWHFNMVILDECHNIKNVNTKRASCAIPLIRRAKRRFLLTGTPCDYALDLLPIIMCLKPEMFSGPGAQEAFYKRYCIGRPVKTKYGTEIMRWTHSSNKQLDDLFALLSKDMMLRRDASVLPAGTLPNEHTFLVYLDDGDDDEDGQGTLDSWCASTSSGGSSSGSDSGSSTEAKDGDGDEKVVTIVRDGDKRFRFRREALDQMSEREKKGINKAEKALDSYKEVDEKDKSVMIKSLQSSYRKQPYVRAYMRPFLSQERFREQTKVLIFGHYKHMLDAACDILDALKLGHVIITGSTPMHKRDQAVHDFQNDPNVRAAVLSIEANGAAITLTAATVVIFMELVWKGSSHDQAKKRALRIGQKHDVEVNYLMLRHDDVDKHKWALIQRKRRTMARAIDGKKHTDTTKVNKQSWSSSR